MNGWCSLGFIGCLLVGAIYCQDSNPLSMDVDQQDDRDAEVKLYVDNQPKSSHVDTEKTVTVFSSTIAQSPEPFACHECTNCNVKSDTTSRVCEAGINMCYTVYKRIDNTTRIISRGCSVSKGQCAIPNDDQSNRFDSVICCTGHQYINRFLASKRSTGSILGFFSKKSKAQASSLSTAEIPLVDFTDLPTSSRDENTEISSATKTSPLVETLNLSNLKYASENDLEDENQGEIFDSSNVSSNTDNPIHEFLR